MLGKVAFSNYLLPVFLILLELIWGGGGGVGEPVHLET
jgi:hypothetical protein